MSTQVKSHVRHLPCLNGKRVNPSGRLPSFWHKPVGSNCEGNSPDVSALFTMSFICEHLGCLPICNLHSKPCLPSGSTITPHGQWHIWEPNRRAHATRSEESSSFNPKDDIGKAYRKSNEF